MYAGKLEQSEIEQIHAFLDGELPAEQAEPVAARIERDPTFSAEANAYRQLDAFLDTWQAPPLRRDLTQAILARTARKREVPAWVRVLAPVAAAAMIFVVVWGFHAVGGSETGTPGRTPIVTNNGSNADTGGKTPLQKELAGLSAEDQFVVENLDLFVNYEILSSFETLEAIERLESGTGGA